MTPTGLHVTLTGRQRVLVVELDSLSGVSPLGSMVRSVAAPRRRYDHQCLRCVHERITPTEAQKKRVSDRADTAKSYLIRYFGSDHDFPASRVPMMGSAARNTQIRPLDNLDVLAEFTTYHLSRSGLVRSGTVAVTVPMETVQTSPTSQTRMPPCSSSERLDVVR